MRALRGALLPVLAVVGFNLLSHFLPFERAALSGDDYQYSTIPPGRARLVLVRDHLTTTYRRPLEISHHFLHWWIGDNKLLWILPLVVASSFLAVLIYFLMREMVGDPALALVCSVFYALLPNKGQLYHYVAYTHIHAVYSFTVAGLLFFFIYLRSSKRAWLWASLFCYAVTLFWYELGFFLPLVLVVAAFSYGRKKLWACALFLLPVLFNVLWRAGLFVGKGFRLGPDLWGGVAFWPKLFLGLTHLYFGRQLLKYLIYGLGRFSSIDTPWLIAFVAVDALVLWGIYRWLRRRALPRVPLKALPVSAVLWVVLVIPAAMGYGIFDRHTGLASIGFSILAVAAIRFFLGSGRIFALVLTCLSGVGLVTCQTTAWNQVVSCRMNNAVWETLWEKRDDLMRANWVLIDQYSFTQEIPYTWVNDPVNQLDTYWGVDGLAGEGFKRMVLTVAGAKRRMLSSSTRIIRSPLHVEGEMFTFQSYNGQTCQFEQEAIPRSETALIDYASVYPRGFHHGKR